MAQPQCFESLGQNQGMVLYRTKLVGHKSGRLILRDLHDYALVFVDGHYLGTIDRRLGQNEIALPKPQTASPVLDILVEAMGHINFGEFIIDRKGVTERATLNGMTLMNWEAFLMPLDNNWITSLPRSASTARPGTLFKAQVNLAQVADTFLDLSAYQKGYVWVNGHNLGRYWNIGPQQRLFCPATWLKKGINEVLVLDLHTTTPQTISGKPALTD